MFTTIPWTVTKVKVLPGHRLAVGFVDGLRGTVDMSKSDFVGVLAALADESYFAQATIRDGVVVWPNDVDIAPDAMYDEVRATQDFPPELAPRVLAAPVEHELGAPGEPRRRSE